MLQMYGSMLGIYAIPNLDNYKSKAWCYYVVWNCIIFVRKGFYKDGKFKFDVVFSHEFPKKPPTFVFKSKLFHPLVRDDGLVDIDALLSESWDYQS